MAWDLSDYLCPANGKAFMLSSGEACQSVQAADGWVEFRKNRLVEEFRVTATTIDRGADTSDLYTDDGQYRGVFYIQYKDASYGCPWVARFMSVGDVYSRRCRVVVRNYTGQVLSDKSVASDITLTTWHDALVLPSGVTVRDVLEFQWSGEERYFYARDHGLVGWRNLADGSFGNYLTGYSAVIQTPVAHPIARPPVSSSPPPTSTPAPTPTPDYPAGSQPIAASVALYGVRLRSAPGLAGAPVRYLAYGERVTVYQQPVVALDGYNWLRVETAQGSGWTAQYIDGKDVFKPAVAASLIALKMPFKRAFITDRFNSPRSYGAHEGVDVIDLNAQQYGSDPTIHVGAPGTVAQVGWDADGYGNFVRVDCGGGWIVWYGHLAEVYVKPGQALKDWQIIGLMGSTGNSTGPHCHVTVQHVGAGLAGYVVADVVDPEPLLLGP